MPHQMRKRRTPGRIAPIIRDRPPPTAIPTKSPAIPGFGDVCAELPFIARQICNAANSWINDGTTIPANPNVPVNLTRPSVCVPPYFMNSRTGKCEIDLVPGPGGGGSGGRRDAEFGEAVAGRHGVGIEPASRMVDMAICPKGMVLGNDDICYNKRQISNKDRQWPAGRAPLLTGGERNAISKANRASKKIERTTKQLQRMGMMKKPVRKAAPRPRALPRGIPGTSMVNFDNG